MKKIIAALMVAVLTLTTFAACSKKDGDVSAETATQGYVAKQPDFPSKEGTKDFSNESGKVVYQVKYKVPELSGEKYSEATAAIFNNYIEQNFLKPVFDFAEINVKNVRENETEPRKIEISYEIKYLSDNILSVVFSTAYSSQNKMLNAKTFNLVEGTVINGEEFFGNDKETVRKAVLEYFLPYATDLIVRTDDMTDEEVETLAAEKLAEAYEPANIYIRDSYIAFVCNKAKFAEGVGAGAGVHEFILDWNTANTLGALSNPEDIFAK